MTIEWRPIKEYAAPKAAMQTPLVLLGWWMGECGSGYSPGIFSAAVGFQDHAGRWIDKSDKKPWPNYSQPTHFACHIWDIPVAMGATSAED